MVFSSLTFLFAYLPLVLLAYFTVPLRFRNLVLLLVSLFFYGWGEPVYVLIMIASITINWLFGLYIAKYRDTAPVKAKRGLVLCIVFNLLLLGFFKYWDFLAVNLNRLNIRFIKPLRLGLPIGISFYTFQTMSYPIDLWRGETTVQKSIVRFGAYVSMFPQLIAGPIVRYTDIAEQLEERSTDTDKFYHGVMRFLCGLAKKVLLANRVGMIFEEISVLPAFSQSALTAWIGILAYAFQIYFDFSGYSDMAIGLGKIFGFDFLENFNYPYISRSVTEFWRRWHMSLSYWFRDYVYIPLGGNRCGLPRQIFNITVVWLLTGFWHGASWNFVLWGVFYGFVLIIEKVFLLKHLQKLPAWVGHLYTILIVLFAWVLFAFTDIAKGMTYFSYMMGSQGLVNGLALYYLRDAGILLVICALASTPYFRDHFSVYDTKLKYAAPVLALLCLFVCTAFIVDASYNPFLYFRF